MSNKIESIVDDIKYLIERWVEVRSEVEDEEFNRITDSGNQIGDTFFQDVENIALNKILDEIRNNKTE